MERQFKHISDNCQPMTGYAAVGMFSRGLARKVFKLPKFMN